MGVNRHNDSPILKRAIVIISCLLIMAIGSSVTLDHFIEDNARKHARYNLEQIRYCMDNTNKYSDYLDKLNICSAKSKTSFTGDVYAIDEDTLEFVYETSRDVPPTKLYFTKESIGEDFYDWDSGKRALYYLTSGKDSESDVNVWYNYDGSPEWLEWIIYPVYDYDKLRNLVIVQGTQSDEIKSEFILYKIMMLISIIVLSLGILINSTYRANNIRNGYDRRIDDCN